MVGVAGQEEDPQVILDLARDEQLSPERVADLEAKSSPVTLRKN